MKRNLLLLIGSLMALAAVATTVAAMNSNDEASLLIRNVEALAWGEWDDDDDREGETPAEKCKRKGGVFDQELGCVDGGVETGIFDRAGEITILGITVSGSRGQYYVVAWERWSCVATTDGCCDASEGGVRIVSNDVY